MKLKIVVGLLFAATVAHFIWAPIPFEPRAFDAPGNRGYTGPFARNTRLGPRHSIALGATHGAEDGALDAHGRLYVSLRDGTIARLEPGADAVTPWVNTGGIPLGLEFDRQGTLWVADAKRGLLSIDTAGTVRVRCAEAAGVPIRFADDVAVTRTGQVYFTDATTKFNPVAHGGLLEASVLAAVEHGGHGRLLRYDDQRDEVTVVRTGLSFANGVALSASQEFLYLVESDAYRVLQLRRVGPDAGTWSVLIDQLPGFPDNIELGLDGRLWVGLVTPRNAFLDFAADKPWLRAAAFRLPRELRPQAAGYGHLIAVTGTGEVVADLQHPEAYVNVTGAVEAQHGLYVTSLTEPILARVPFSGGQP